MLLGPEFDALVNKFENKKIRIQKESNKSRNKESFYQKTLYYIGIDNNFGWTFQGKFWQEYRVYRWLTTVWTTGSCFGPSGPHQRVHEPLTSL
jgi:hypothetical protein